MNTINFSGLTTALITPFKNNRPDFAALDKILIKQASAKVDAILLFGTTGEGLSLSTSEKKSIFLLAKSVLTDRIPIIACISSPVTHLAVDCLKEFNLLGVNGIMAITPYYYKCTEDGIVKHFKELTKNTALPIIAYNVPSRTSCNISNMPKVIDFFNECNQIVAIKEADNSLENCLNLLTKTQTPLLCGNDKFLYKCLIAGYKGAISVLSNLFPKEIKEIISLSSNNKDEALTIFNNLMPIIDALDIVPNPIGVKYAAKLLFDCSDDLRLPLTPTNHENKLKIIKEIIKYKEKS